MGQSIEHAILRFTVITEIHSLDESSALGCQIRCYLIQSLIQSPGWGQLKKKLGIRFSKVQIGDNKLFLLESLKTIQWHIFNHEYLAYVFEKTGDWSESEWGFFFFLRINRIIYVSSYLCGKGSWGSLREKSSYKSEFVCLFVFF